MFIFKQLLLKSFVPKTWIYYVSIILLGISSFILSKFVISVTRCFSEKESQQFLF